MIEVKEILGKGRGIVTTQNISQGTLLEVAPVSTFTHQQIISINETEVFKYYFVNPLEYGKSKNVGGYLVFGLASLCNHQEKPNARVNWVENKVGLWSHLIALQDIKDGEEVTLFYTNIDEYTENFV